MSISTYCGIRMNWAFNLGFNFMFFALLAGKSRQTGPSIIRLRPMHSFNLLNHLEVIN